MVRLIAVPPPPASSHDRTRQFTMRPPDCALWLVEVWWGWVVPGTRYSILVYWYDTAVSSSYGSLLVTVVFRVECGTT